MNFQNIRNTINSYSSIYSIADSDTIDLLFSLQCDLENAINNANIVCSNPQAIEDVIRLTAMVAKNWAKTVLSMPDDELIKPVFAETVTMFEEIYEQMKKQFIFASLSSEETDCPIFFLEEMDNSKQN